ncbi:hypothetical protein CC78DRAFT_619931 [Lojkania enalia]|uniref:CBF1-interacting co-repressor CIR N-terminal domain-containing protein n=1 Tax=Lojkania enalia TaxID=147567 RepID=A0A9P4N0U0_9PLEO|nr:hypothetical protein CC78DRAFT_619931 [Didymosphaeria enalia]
MGGDLNLKKSWHPGLSKNQERVWKSEKAALEERKQIEKLRKEREEERQIEELQKLAEASGGKVAQKRVDWMYAGPSGDGQGVTEEREAYLLGKRRIDNLLKASDAETSALRKGAAVGIEAVGGGSAVNALDTKKKVLDDPLLLIQKQRMELQIQQMREAQKEVKRKEKMEKERERRHRHRHNRRDRSRSDDEDYDRWDRHRRRDRLREDSEEYDRRHRHRPRSRSPRRRDDRNSRDHNRRRSRSPYRKSERDNYRRRSRSPRRRFGADDNLNFRRRSRTPPRLSYDSFQRSRSRSPYRRTSNEDQHRRHYSDEDKPRHARSPPATKQESPQRDTQSVTDRLAAMQADAKSLEEQRSERVRLREAEDAVEEAKHKHSKEGGHRFISNVRRGVGDMDLGEVMARGRQGFSRACEEWVEDEIHSVDCIHHHDIGDWGSSARAISLPSMPIAGPIQDDNLDIG